MPDPTDTLTAPLGPPQDAATSTQPPPSAPPTKSTGFRVVDALGAGYSPDEVTAYLTANPQYSPHFDVGGAMKAGYSSQEVLNHLVGPMPATLMSSDEQTELAGKMQQALGSGHSPQQITSYVAASTGPYAARMKASLALGYDPAAIVDHLAETGGGALQGLPVLAPVMRGVAHAMSGVADLAGDVGLTGVGSAIRSHIDQEDLQAPQSGASLVSDLKAGKLGAAIGDLPSAALEQAPTIVPAIAAGVLTGGAGDVALLTASLRAATAGVLSGATQGDAAARARAANNGRSTPSTSDLIAGITGAAGAGAVGSIGLGGTGTGLTGALRGVATHAVADATQPELQSLAGSVGTTAGAQNIDPATAAASALTGAATRGALEAPAAATAAYTAISPAARIATNRAAYAAMSPDAQQRVSDTAAAGQALEDAQGSSATGSPVSVPQAATIASGNLAAHVQNVVGAATNDGFLDDDGRQVIGTALRSAQSPTGRLTNDQLDQVNGLGLDPQTGDTVTAALRRIDLLSGAAGAQSVGPFQRGLSAAGGPLAGAALGGMLGDGGMGAVAGAAIGGSLRPAVAGVLGGLGAHLDRVLGLSAQPSLVLDAAKAARQLSAAGVPIPNTRQQLVDAIGTNRDAVAQQRNLMGLPANDPGETMGPAAGGPQAAPGAAQGPTQGNPGATSTPNATTAPAAPEGLLPGALNQAAQGMAARLPDWQFGVGSAVDEALARAGQPMPLNYAQEAHGALDSLEAAGLLPKDVVDALRGHNGRLVPLLYGMIRNQALLNRGIDRRTLAAQQAGLQSAAVMPMSMTAE